MQCWNCGLKQFLVDDPMYLMAYYNMDLSDIIDEFDSLPCTQTEMTS